MKLRTKILAILAPLVVTPLLGLGAVAYIQLVQVSHQRIIGQLSTTVDHLQAHADTEIRAAVANIELLSQVPVVRKYALATDAQEKIALLQPALLRLFHSYQRAYPHYYEIRILDPSGREDVRATPISLPNVTENESASPYFRAAAASVPDIYSTIELNPDGGETALYVVKRLRLRDRATDRLTSAPKLRGYLVLTVALPEIREHLRSGRVGDSGYLLATDDEGNVLHGPDDAPGFVGARLPPALARTLSDPDATDWPLRLSVAGERLLVTGRRLHAGLTAFAVLPEAETLAAARRMGLTVTLVTAVTIASIVGITFLVLNHLVVGPIRRLGQAAQRIGDGDLEVRLGIDTGDEVADLASSFNRMSESLQDSHRQIHFLAYHDSLTGLPNRAMFMAELERSLDDARRHRSLLALLFLDIDDFKRVNDTLGHAAGDALLAGVAERLQDSMRGEDFLARTRQAQATTSVARLGGDEFIFLLAHLHDPLHAAVVARRVIEILRRPFVLSGQEFFIGVSVGITTYPHDGADLGTLIKNADLAMYHAKRSGKNNYQFFSASMNAETVQRLSTENRLRKALEQDRFVLHYQPLIDARRGDVVGAEALLRWTDPQAGVLLPADFIRVAEETGLILPVGRWALREACRQNRAWQDAGLPRIPVSVNVSSLQFTRQDLPALFAETLQDVGLEGRYLELEVTETTILAVPERAEAALRAVQGLGIRVALDDFGTGYSSLGHLRRFPVSRLKIDRSFVQDVCHDDQDAELVSAIIAMAHSLHLDVVAEGVENEGQRGFLADHDCDVLQGFLFSEPLAADGFAELLLASEARKRA